MSDVPEEPLWAEATKKALIEVLRIATVYVKNDLDQDVVVQIKGMRSKSYTDPVNIGSSFTVSAGDVDARTITPETSGWMPYITVTLKCSAAPSNGTVTAYFLRYVDYEETLVDSLAITDTNEHDPTTDTEIKILEW